MNFVEKRLNICRNCAIYNETREQCSATLWLDPVNNVAYPEKGNGRVKGCGCYIPTKVKRESNVCPASKW